MILSDTTRARFEREVAKYPPEHRQSAVLACLAIVQQEQGHITAESEQAVADYLGMPRIAVREVATFYNMYDLKPVGKYKITVCTNLPCALSGGVDCADYLKHKLGVGFGETTADGKFTLLEGECMGACGDAPVLLVNNHKMCSFMTPEAIDQKLAEFE